jgi:hypothetical protein
MKRRNFIKTTAAGSALIMASGAFAFGNPMIAGKNMAGSRKEKYRLPTMLM